MNKQEFNERVEKFVTVLRDLYLDDAYGQPSDIPVVYGKTGTGGERP